MTMTITMTHSKKSIQQSLVAWPYRRERRGHDPTRMSLSKLVWRALLARCALTHTIDDSVQYIGSQVETRGEKTQAVAGVNSLNSSRGNPWFLCNATKGTTRDPGRQPDSRRKCVANIVAHQPVLIAFHLSLSQDWWYAFSASLLVETSHAPVATVLRGNLSTHRS